MTRNELAHLWDFPAALGGQSLSKDESEQRGPVNQNELERFFMLVVSLCFPSLPQVLLAGEG